MKEADAIQAASVPAVETDPQPIFYVCIPADSSKPMQEFSFIPTQRTGKVGVVGDALAEHLKAAFSGSTDAIDMDLLHHPNRNHETPYQLVGGGGGEGGDVKALLSNVSAETLKNVAKQGNVETFTLVHAIPSNNFLGVNIYLDEVGMLKRLPLNYRATSYAKQAGFHPPPHFYGTVFLGRVHKQNAVVVRNLSLRLGPDTAMDAEWLQRAAMENLDYQMELNRLTGQNNNNHTQPPPLAGDGTGQAEEGYSWTQTELELELVVPLPIAANVVKSKDIQVKFKSQSIQVSHQGQSLVSLELFERVDLDSCTWTIEKKGDEPSKLVITMEKVETAFWPRIKD
jgi:hypothetical protein